VTIAIASPTQAPITDNGLFSAHLSNTALIRECSRFLPIIATNEKDVAKTEKKNGRKAITAIKFRGIQLCDQILNERANVVIPNTASDALATMQANGTKIQNSGTDRISNNSKNTLAIMSTQKKFEISKEIADTTRPVAQISRSMTRQTTNEPKHSTTLATNKNKKYPALYAITCPVVLYF
jgi:hypothetical protein